MSDFMVVVSQKANKTLKYATRYKAFLKFADIEVDAIFSDETKMLGLELEVNLADTGLEVR